MKIRDAATLMENCYAYEVERKAGAKASSLKHLMDVAQSYNVDGVQAYLLKDKTLVVPGTNEMSDWGRYNLATRRVWSQNLSREAGASGALWHKGFLAHARAVYNFVVMLKPKFLIGHSLGAASVQIAGASLAKPTVAFASPRTKHGKAYFKGEGWVVNINRVDDTVCHVPPPSTGYRHLGSQYWMAPSKVNVGGDHQMKHYIRLLDDKHASRNVPKKWPVDS